MMSICKSDEDTRTSETSTDSGFESPGKKRGRKKIHEDITSQQYRLHRIPCIECNMYITRRNMDAHLAAKHYNTSRYGCDLCQRYFFYKSLLSKHMKIHINNRSFSCRYCDKKFVSKPLLNMHEKRKHLGIYNEQCSYCGKIYDEKVKLDTHIRSKHTFERPFKCEIMNCGKAFFSAAHLSLHKTGYHSGHVTCTICSKVFSTKNSLKIHVKTHENVEYLCKFMLNGVICNKSFTTKYSLNNHSKAHINQRDYPCSKCSAQFFTRETWRHHYIAIHLKFRMKCVVNGCEKTYSRKEQMRKHIREFHTDYQGKIMQILLSKITEYKIPEVHYERPLKDFQKFD